MFFILSQVTNPHGRVVDDLFYPPCIDLAGYFRPLEYQARSHNHEFKQTKSYNYGIHCLETYGLDS